MMEQIKGAKYDEGKPRPSLVPVEGIEAIMHVREFGKAKYADAEDWRKVPREKWLEALLRHVLHIWDNPLAIDDESGLPALWHVITNAAFLCAAYKDELLKEQIEWTQQKVDQLKADYEQDADDDQKEWEDGQALCCAEIYCKSFSTNCENNCMMHLDGKECTGGKEVTQCEDASGRGND